MVSVIDALPGSERTYAHHKHHTVVDMANMLYTTSRKGWTKPLHRDSFSAGFFAAGSLKIFVLNRSLLPTVRPYRELEGNDFDEAHGGFQDRAGSISP